MTKIGIFGGSFNPVHAGHVELARFALSELNLDRVIFVPCHINPLKRQMSGVLDRYRIDKLREKLFGHKRFSICLFEIQKKRISYTIHTLRYFQKKFGPKTKLYFLTGADCLKDLKRWKSIRSLLRQFRFVAVSRPGYALRSEFKDVLLMPFEALDISSTKIRKKRSVA